MELRSFSSDTFRSAVDVSASNALFKGFAGTDHPAERAVFTLSFESVRREGSSGPAVLEDARG